ncbi:TPA: glycosyl transferase [Vibrio alginolyticus]
MSSYSGLERNIARVLRRFPAIKEFAKFCYSRLMYVRAKKSYKFKSEVSPIAYSNQSRESFFGYYDKSPENSLGMVITQLSSRSTSLLPSIEKSVEVAVFDNNQEMLLSLSVNAYNWQQGCRAHWLNEDLFIFNDYDSERNIYIAKIYSVSERKQIKEFSHAVQDSFKDEYFISLNYKRLMTLRPDYGYRNTSLLKDKELRDNTQDGLWFVDIKTGNTKLLFSLDDACKINPTPDFQSAVHKFNHVMISPSGEHFIFMHRYLLGKRRFDRLIKFDITTGNVTLLSDFGMVSHCFWVNESTVLGFMRGPNGVDGYWLIDVTYGNFTPFQHEKLSGYGDGHPHVVGDWFVTDTYPDKARMQHLLLCNLVTGEVKPIGEFFHGFEFSGETRCDLHPRLSSCGTAVFFDSVFSGKRQLYRMDLPK